MRITTFFAAILIFSGFAFAQLPQCEDVSGWQQHGPARSYDAENLFEYMNGNSEGYFIYWFVAMKGITCQSGDRAIVIDISEFYDSEYAYGMFTSTLDPRLPVEKIGMSGQITSRRGFFVKDKYYVELAANPEGDFTPELRAYMSIIEKSISGQTALPEPIGWFPTEKLLDDSTVRLIPESVLGLRVLKSGYVGPYDFGRGFVVQESSPEAAAEVMEKLKERFGQTAPVTIADEAFTANDKYLNGMCVFRKGNIIGGFADLRDGRDGVAESTSLAANIK